MNATYIFVCSTVFQKFDLNRCFLGSNCKYVLYRVLSEFPGILTTIVFVKNASFITLNSIDILYSCSFSTIKVPLCTILFNDNTILKISFLSFEFLSFHCLLVCSSSMVRLLHVLYNIHAHDCMSYLGSFIIYFILL